MNLMRSITYTLFFLQLAIIIVSFLVSTLMVWRKNIDWRIKIFVLYPFVAVLVFSVLIYSMFFDKSVQPNATILNNYSLLFHFSFLSFFIYTKLKLTFIKRLLIFSFFSFFIIIIIVLFSYSQVIENKLAFSISNIGLIISCLFYYYDVYSMSEPSMLFKDPVFIIVTGIFICMSMHIPFTAVFNVFPKKISITMRELVQAILCFSYLSMHLFFIKAYICVLQIQKS